MVNSDLQTSFDEDEEFLFADEDAPVEVDTSDQDTWKILVVDDEEAVHQVTRLALEDFEFDGRSLEFVDAYTGSEAINAIRENPDVAVMLLDVVMESDHAGLEVVQKIRGELKNNNVRIILRTGQPGQAPEAEVIQKYDINDYKEKTELTAQKFTTLMYASLRSYRDIIALERNKLGLEHIIDSTADIFGLKNIDHFTEGVLQQLTSLINIGSSAAYMQTSGLAVCPKGETMPVLVGVGEFKELEGKDAKTSLSECAIQDIQKAIESRGNYYEGDRFAGYFSSSYGQDNVLYITGLRDMSALDRNLIEVFARNIGIAYENIDLHKEIEETQREIVYMLGEAVETRSKETGNHVKRVAEISKYIALQYGMSEEEAEVLRLASPLHDVGKIGIPDAILNKPGKLDAAEWEIMKTHAMLGSEMLKSSKKRILKAGAVIAAEHHEKWDGSGYPFSKSGDDIHIYGRITALADVFDALGNDRCYKKAWPLDKVVNLIKEERGKHFEPRIVDILLENLDDIVGICNEYQDI